MKFHLILAALLPATAIAASAAAQDQGGLRLTFSLSERLEATRNLALDPVSKGITLRSDTSLGVNVSSVTRSQSLTFSSNLALNAIKRPGSGTDFDISDPTAKLAYRRSSAQAEFNISASLRNDDISFLRPLSDFIDENGVLQLPEDINDLRGTGTRRNYGGSTSLRWGVDGPLEMGVSAGVNMVDYISAAPTLFDNRTAWAGAHAKFAITPVTSLSTNLRFSRFMTDNPGLSDRTTISLKNRLNFDRRDGKIYGSLGLSHVPSGTRVSVGAGWQRDLANGQLGLTLSTTRTAAGELTATGSANISRAYAFGNLSAQVRRSVLDGNDNTEQMVTGATVSFNRDLTPRTSLSLGADYARTTALSSDLSTTNATLRASLSHALTPDWSANLGYNRRYRNIESAGTGWTNSDSISFGISRQLATRW